MDRLKNIEGKKKEQLKTIKNKHLKLVKILKDDKPKLKSLRHHIDKRDKEQLKYFDDLIKQEIGIDYTKLYYQSGNENKDAFNFKDFGSMVDFFQWLRTGWITLRETGSKLRRFSGLLNILNSTTARRKSYEEKKAEVLENAELLLKEQK